MDNRQCKEFQQSVSQLLLRHQSILDILSKSQEANSRLNRAVTKTITSCGCLKVKAVKKPFPKEACVNDLKELLNSHLEGKICPSCRDVVIDEMGRSLFYLVALCNTLDINLDEVIEQEKNKLTTLGMFNFT